MGVYFPFLDPNGFPETPPPLGLTTTITADINEFSALVLQNGLVVSGVSTFAGDIQAQDIIAQNLQVTGVSNLIVNFDGGPFQS